MKTWAFYSLKGGVGKTAAAVNLAFEAAQAGENVLLWDLDPQSAASWYLGVDDGLATPVKRLLAGKDALGGEIAETAQERVHVLPGGRACRSWDVEIHATAQPRNALVNLINPFAKNYSLLILDCPPGIGSLATAVLRAADRAVVPVIPTPLSLRALDEVMNYMEDKKVGRTLVTPFFSMADRRRRMHRELIETPPESMKNAPRAFIDYSTDIEQMGLHRAPVRTFAPGSRAALEYQALYAEIAEAAPGH